MTEKMLTVRMSEQEHRALKLYAVLQGRSINAVVTDLIPDQPALSHHVNLTTALHPRLDR
jgi:predicted HicB family RNase H-like nuclease